MTHEQEILTDSVLLSAITSAGGNPRLLLAVFRDDARALYTEPNLALRVFDLVEARRVDPEFRPAFPRVRPAAPSVSPDTLPESSEQPRSVRIADTLRSLLQWCASTWRAIVDAWRSTPSFLIKKSPDPKPEPKALPIVDGCGFETMLHVHCVGGELTDADGDRGPCCFEGVLHARCSRGSFVDDAGHDRGWCVKCAGTGRPPEL